MPKISELKTHTIVSNERNISPLPLAILSKVSGRFATLLFATGLFAIGIIATGNIRHRNFRHNVIHLLGFFATLAVEILPRLIRHSHSEMWQIFLFPTVANIPSLKLY